MMNEETDKKIDHKDVHLIVYDFDGVMTDNKVFVFQDGKEAVICNRADGLAISEIKKIGIPQIIISTETNLVVKARAEKLDLPVLHGIDDKTETLKKYCAEHSIKLKRVLYIGNDSNDLESMKIVGYPVSPADATKEVKKISMIVTKKKGGDGVIREILGLIR